MGLLEALTQGQERYFTRRGKSLKNYTDVIILQTQVAFERKQLVLMADEKQHSQISHRHIAIVPLRKEGSYGRRKEKIPV